MEGRGGRVDVLSHDNLKHIEDLKDRFSVMECPLLANEVCFHYKSDTGISFTHYLSFSLIGCYNSSAVELCC